MGAGCRSVRRLVRAMSCIEDDEVCIWIAELREAVARDEEATVQQTWCPAEPDEYDERLRSLEAERLRPVPPPPVSQKRPTTAAERNAARREAATAEHIRQLVEALHGAENDDVED